MVQNDTEQTDSSSNLLKWPSRYTDCAARQQKELRPSWERFSRSRLIWMLWCKDKMRPDWGSSSSSKLLWWRCGSDFIPSAISCNFWYAWRKWGRHINCIVASVNRIADCPIVGTVDLINMAVDKPEEFDELTETKLLFDSPGSSSASCGRPNRRPLIPIYSAIGKRSAPMFTCGGEAKLFWGTCLRVSQSLKHM